MERGLEHRTYEGSHDIKVGHIYHIKWVATEYVTHALSLDYYQKVALDSYSKKGL